MKLNKYYGIRKWMRILHRDIGYFLTGITLVYALSGIFLTHKEIFPSFSAKEYFLQMNQGLSSAEFANDINRTIVDNSVLNTIEKGNSIIFYIKNGKGSYNIDNGMVQYEIHSTCKFIRFLNQLHVNSIKYWRFIADFFAVLLIFLVVSGLLIVPGKNGFLKRGVWFMIAGFALVLVFIWIE